MNNDLLFSFYLIFESLFTSLSIKYSNSTYNNHNNKNYIINNNKNNSNSTDKNNNYTK
jgi:hypothetical protein